MKLTYFHVYGEAVTKSIIKAGKSTCTVMVHYGKAETNLKTMMLGFQHWIMMIMIIIIMLMIIIIMIIIIMIIMIMIIMIIMITIIMIIMMIRFSTLDCRSA